MPGLNRISKATCVGCGAAFPLNHDGASIYMARGLCRRCSPTLDHFDHTRVVAKTNPKVVPKHCTITANDMAKVLGTNVCEVASLLVAQGFAGSEMAVLEKAFGPDFNPYSVVAQV